MPVEGKDGSKLLLILLPVAGERTPFPYPFRTFKRKEWLNLGALKSRIFSCPPLKTNGGKIREDSAELSGTVEF